MKGIYGIFRKADDKCMYVGQSKRLDERIYDHLIGKTQMFNKEQYYGKVLEEHDTDNIEYRLDREVYWIKQLNPEFNVIRDRHYNSGDDNPMYGKSGKANPMYGKQHTEFSRKKMSNSRMGARNSMYGKNPEDFMTPEAIIEKRKKDSEAIKGMKFINNGVINKRAKGDDLDKYIQDGWKLGRLPWKKNL